MEARIHGKSMTRRLMASLFGIAVFLVVSESQVFAGDGTPVLSAQTELGVGANAPQPSAVTQGTPGMMIYLDPQTGAILKEPPPGSVPLPLSERERNALSTSHDGLVQVPSALPGGGVKIDLQGRFQKPLVATVDANGKFKMQRSGAPPNAGDQK